MTAGAPPVPGRERGVEILGRFAAGRASVRLVGGSGATDLDSAMLGWASAGDPRALTPSALREATGAWAVVRRSTDGSRLEAAVDQLGDVPLYWARQANETIVASDLRLLLAELGTPAAPHLPRVLEWIAWSFSDPLETLFEGVRTVPAGHRLVVDAGGAQLRRYWQPVAQLDNRADAETWLGRLRPELSGALRRHLPAEPYALLLSGGLDSSTLAGWITADETLPQPAVAASLRYPRLPSDETAYQEAVLRFTGLKPLVVEPQPFDVDAYVARITSAAMPVHVAAPETDELYRALGREGIHIAIDGVGGDELFAPIRWGIEELVLQRRWRTIGRWWGLQGGRGIRRELRGRLSDLDPVGTRGIRARRRVPAYVPAAARRLLGTRLVPPRSLPGIHATGRERAEYFTSAKLAVGRSIDASRSRVSDVEFRMPFFDVGLIELALGIPDSMRHRGDDARWLQREAFGSRLPSELLARRGKVHFDYRYAQHLQHPWVREQLETSHLAAAGLLDRDAVLADYDRLAEAVRTDIAHLPYLASPLWRVVGLETWWRAYVA
ncbi:MAG: asparagine synthase-related protein [Chloroflexi bacterium]|nr:asparagine synthase-related protein [Chloroflexota bacterium]MDA1147104.1 asparagine synthase-related protein [Chloroflexota bacterium]